MNAPQLKNGYTRIANEIMEALAKIRIPGEPRQILDAIIRKTYGWDKMKDKISLSQFVKATGLKKVTICKGISKLLQMNIITKKVIPITQYGNNDAVTCGTQKDYSKRSPLPNMVMPITQYGNNVAVTYGIQKDYIK